MLDLLGAMRLSIVLLATSRSRLYALATIVAASSGWADMNSTALRRPRRMARMKSPLVAAASPVVTPITLHNGGSASLAETSTRNWDLFFDHTGSAIAE